MFSFRTTRQDSQSVSLECMFCFAELRWLSISQREAHYEHHFINDIDAPHEGQRTASTLLVPLRKSGPDPNASKPRFRKSPFPCNKETDVFWHAAQSTPPPPSYTPGLVPLLRKGLLKGHARGYIRRAVLCCDTAVHVNREPWDAGWGCGYRNFLMACTVLMNQRKQPLYPPLLDFPISPGIRNLQTWIEAAWKEGFDPDGQQQLKRLVNTHKWIGTSDLWVAFISRAIPAELVDFQSQKDSQFKISDVVINWVVKYFTPEQIIEKPMNAFESLETSPVINTDKPPLILQHDGHSKTVVGYEVDKNGMTSLLVFDPAHKPSLDVRKAAISTFRLASVQNDSRANDSGSTHSLKRKRSGTVEDKELDLHGIVKKFRLEPKALGKKKEYQILYFPMTAPLTDYERMQRKEVQSIRII
ncbi:peptidase family C78-domain-containing protein [Gymnopilus junonius]|uniref:Peptidase family C78-domain-containing protein n=1 Tax=Gymnopilus junonius TaxID=109634 RepID=A0A9P5NTP2_GYMJU|nr:peptidase family C78-domain-containing protein [Gymnopilus junonius]